MRLLKWLCQWLLVSAMMFVLAYMFVQAWDATEFVNQAKRAAHMDSTLYPAPQSWVKLPKVGRAGQVLTYSTEKNEWEWVDCPKPTDMAKPKTKVFQDASTKRGK